MIGLRRHTVQVVDHQREWGDLYCEEARILHDVVGHLVEDIQHVGSTAVPGLVAKPILDIAVAVSSLAAIPDIVGPLVAAGYIDRGDTAGQGGYLLFRESRRDVRTVHIHIVEYDGKEWRGYLKFRDTLCRNAAIRNEYATLKVSLAEQFKDDRGSYTAGKHEFVTRILNEGPNH